MDENLRVHLGKIVGTVGHSSQNLAQRIQSGAGVSSDVTRRIQFTVLQHT